MEIPDKFPEAPEELSEVLNEQQYEMIETVGFGGSAIVYLVKSLKYGQNFILKRILNNTNTEFKHEEVEMLRKLNNPGIIRLYGYVLKSIYSYVFIEYCPFGSMSSYIKKNGPLDGSMILAVAKCLLTSLVYMHLLKISHSDIKPENMLIDAYGRVKLADFGLSKVFDQSQVSTDRVGSLPFWAPEMISSKSFDPFACDIWALGISLYVMHTGHLPWENKTRDEYCYAIVHSDIVFPPDSSHRVNILLRKMLQPKKRRPTAMQLLKDDLLSDISAEVRLPIQNNPVQLNEADSSTFTLTRIPTAPNFLDGSKIPRSLILIPINNGINAKARRMSLTRNFHGLIPNQKTFVD